MSCDLILNYFPLFFSKMRQGILTTGYLSFMKICVARTFLVELHPGVILEALLVVGSKNTIGRFTDKIRMIALLMPEIFNFLNFEKKNNKI